MSVRDYDLIHFQFVLLEDGNDFVDVVTGIDHHCVVRGLVPEDRAIAPQRADGQNGVDHKPLSPNGRKSTTSESSIRAQMRRQLGGQLPSIPLTISVSYDAAAISPGLNLAARKRSSAAIFPARSRPA